MNELFALFRDLLLLRRGPQDLPYSQVLLAVLCVVSVLVDLLLVGLPLTRALFALALLIVLPALALSMAGLAPRLVQTAIALVATGIVFRLLALPILAGVGELPTEPADLTPRQQVFGLISFAVLVYQVAVKGHILRHAMDVPLRAGILLAMAFFVIELVVGLAVFSGSAA